MLPLEPYDRNGLTGGPTQNFTISQQNQETNQRRERKQTNKHTKPSF